MSIELSGDYKPVNYKLTKGYVDNFKYYVIGKCTLDI